MSRFCICTCKPQVLHAVECAVISPYGVCEFCKEPRLVDGVCFDCDDPPTQG